MIGFVNVDVERSPGKSFAINLFLLFQIGTLSYGHQNPHYGAQTIVCDQNKGYNMDNREKDMVVLRHMMIVALMRSLRFWSNCCDTVALGWVEIEKVPLDP